MAWVLYMKLCLQTGVKEGLGRRGSKVKAMGPQRFT